ncbi:MAG: hypothetical protein KGV43_03070 [Arcobacter sp.]|nr:hypothetical protein [Arcobacter sp.]
MKKLLLSVMVVFAPMLVYGNSAKIGKLVGSGQNAYTMAIVDNLVVYTYPYMQGAYSEEKTNQLLTKTICSNAQTKTDIQNGYKYVFVYTGNKKQVMTAIVSECK